MANSEIDINRKTVTSNLLWRFLERFGAQIVSFVVSIILARLLNPTIYGTIALVTVFTSFLNVFIDSGFGTALIQKKDSDDLDFSTVFYFNIIVCIALYVGIFFFAPVISNFYDKSELTLIVRILSITLLISGIKSIQISYVSKHMLFKKFFWSTLIGTIISAFVGIFMAYKGYGVWALVALNLTNQTIDTIVLWVSVKWKPKLMFSFGRLKTLFSFGWKLLASKLLDVGYREASQLIIGKRFSSEDLAIYNKGKQFPELLVTNINTSIDSVLFPSISHVQDRKERVKAMTRRALKTSVFIMAPMMIGIAAIGENLIMLLLGEQWMGCVFFLRIFCITFIFYPVHTANLNAIKAMGRSDYFLVLEIIKKGIGIASILITMWISVEAMAWSLLVTTAINMFINAFPNKKLLNYSYFEQLKDIMPAILIAAFMGVGVYFIEYIPFPHYALEMIVQIIVGIVFYILICRLFKLESYFYVKNMAFDFVNTKIIRKQANKKNKTDGNDSNNAIDDQAKDQNHINDKENCDNQIQQEDHKEDYKKDE